MLEENKNNNPAKGAILGGFVGNLLWPGLGGIIAGGLLGGYLGAYFDGEDLTKTAKH